MNKGLKILFSIGPLMEILFSIIMLTELIDTSSDMFYLSITAVKIVRWLTVAFIIWRIWGTKQMKNLIRIVWALLFVLFGPISIPVYVWAIDKKYENKDTEPISD